MGYSGGSLARLGEAGIEPMRSAAQRTAKRVGELLHERTVEHTPIAKPPAGHEAEWLAARKRLPGTLRESWRLGEVVVAAGSEHYSIDVYTLDPIAPHVEYPTRPHLIYPTGFSSSVATRRREQPMLRWWSASGIHFAWVVHHPGTQGSYMLHRALAEVASVWQEIGAEEMERWARETEAAI